MRYRKIDNFDDYIFGLNQSGFYKDIEAVAQAICTTIKLLKGEWWENVEEGTPIFQSVLGGKIQPDTKQSIDLIIKERILDVKDVETILDYESHYDTSTREYTLNCDISTAYGNIENLTINNILEV